MLAAAAACFEMGVGKSAIQKGLSAFRPLHHRIEPLGAARGVAFVNDSKSTTVDSTRAALASCGQKVVLIAGGRAKERDFSAIVPALRGRVTALVLYGEARKLIASQMRGFKKTLLVEDFAGAVRRAFGAAKPGQTVLLSPMCASFDQFGSYEERGDAFKKIFGNLKVSRG